MRLVGVVVVDPFDQLAIGLKRSKAGAEPGLDRRILHLPGAQDVVVDRTRLGRGDLDHDRGVAVSLHQALEQMVAYQQDLFAPVEGFADPEQLHRVAQRSDDPVHCAIDGHRGVDAERDRIMRDPGVEGGLS